MTREDQKEVSMFVIGLIAGIILGACILHIRLNQHWEIRCINARVAEYIIDEDGKRFRFLTEPE